MMNGPPTHSRHVVAARLPCRLAGRTVRLRPTRYGAGFVAVLGLMLTGSIRYNNNLGFLLVFLLGGMLVVSLFHTRRNLVGLRIVSCSSSPVFAGEAAEFVLVADPGRRRRRAVSLRFDHSDTQTLDLSAGRPAEAGLQTAPLNRGRFSAGRLHLSTRYPLGLFAARALLATGADCLVYPRPVPGPFAPAVGGKGRRDGGRGTREAGADDFQGLRAYAPGDPLQRLSWKAFSRGMGLHTKSFVSAAGGSVCIDWFRLTDADDERRLGRLCDMVLKAQRSGRVFGLRLPGGVVAPATGAAHGRRCLAELALFGGGATFPGRPSPAAAGEAP